MDTIEKKLRQLQGSSEAGFTIVEILVSLFVMSILLGAASSVITSSVSLNAATTRRADASEIVFQKVQNYINTTFDSIPIGDDVTNYEVEDFSSEVVDDKLKNAVAKVFVEPASSVDAVTTTTTTNYAQTISSDSTYTNGSELNVIDVDDATGDYWQRDRLSDNSYTNYTYNRYDPNPDNKAVPSIDLGSARLVDTLRIDWYYCSYGATNFRIEAKNSSPTTNSGWTTIVSGLSDYGIPCSTGSNPQDIDVSSNTTPYRYWRMYIVDATDSNYNVISEFEAFSAGVPGDIVEQQGSDATSSPGALDFSSSTLEMSQDGSKGHQSTGIIFNSVQAPQASTIDNAYIEFQSSSSESGAVTLVVRAADEDNADTAWSGTFAVDNAVDTNAADGRVGTSASTTWTPGAWSNNEVGADTRVNVTPILQEIVNRAGWSANNDVAFVVQYVSGSGRRVASRSQSPKLVVDWSESITTTSSGSYVDLDADGDADNPTLLKITARITYDVLGRSQNAEYVTFVRKYGLGG